MTRTRTSLFSVLTMKMMRQSVKMPQQPRKSETEPAMMLVHNLKKADPVNHQ